MTDSPNPSPSWTEADRLEVLRNYEILDTDSEQAFDDLTKIASIICGTPISMITLIDRNRQWFKSSVGIGDMRQTSLDVSICRHAIQQSGVFVVPDMSDDPRFMDNPLVSGNPHVRFYAGALLETADGVPLGTICVLDYKPRALTAQQGAALQALSRQVMAQLDLRVSLKKKSEAEERLRLALESGGMVGAWDWHINEDRVFSDSRFAAFFSVPAKVAAAGAPLKIFTRSVHPEDAAGAKAALEKTLLTGQDLSHQYRILQADGKILWVLVTGKVHQDEDGSPSRITGIVVDLTAEHAAREALESSEEKFRQLADLIPQIVWMADADGKPFWYSSKLMHYSGISVEDLFKGARDRLYHPDQYEAITQRQKSAWRDGTIWEDIAQLRGADGQYRWFLGRAVPLLGPDGKVARWFGTYTDVEDQKKAEELLVEACARAEEANIAKSEFLANMSHEIRTPMNAVIGLANILSASQPLTPMQKEYLRTLQLSADSLLALINDLLDIARIESRTIALEETPLVIDQVVQEVISMVTVRADEKGLKFHVDTGCAKGRTFIGDPARLRQILLNLCSNAVKFTEHGGIDVSIDCEPHENDPAFETICIKVTDTGIGIAPDKLDLIFHKFVQADTSISRKYGGTGLGLAITKTMVEIMGGKVHVESTLGVGSTFKVCVPLRKAPDQMAAKSKTAEAPRQAAASSSACVLLVEDYAPNVLVASTFVEHFGYDCDVATNGQEALEKIRNRHDYAAVLMDVQMHGINGLEATKLIREHERSKGLPRLPVIGMTAHALAGDREQCLASGMDDYIPKPFNPDDLEAKLKRLARKV
jgi:PAS domain S-box-containing protein